MSKTQKKPGATISDLADKHNCDRATIRRHLKAAGLEPIAKHRETRFFDPKLADEAISLALGSGKKSVSKELREAKLREEITRLRLANEEKTGKLIPRTDHQNEITEMSTEVQRRMYALPSRAPELAGLSVPDIELKLTAWMDEVVAALGKE